MYYAYIIESKEGRRCIGMTKDMDSKLRQHNEKSSIWTKKGTKWKVIFMEEFSDEVTASNVKDG
jgi:predicted GIY-YIG superfamily endonuclease